MTAISQPSSFRHEAFFYSGPEEFVAGTAPFVAEAVQLGEPVLVVVTHAKATALRAALGSAADPVEFADMDVVGRNPARILPAWQEFVDRHAGVDRPLRGVGEPVSPNRSVAALSECHRHEALLNVAFEHSPPWWLLCPYDTAALSTDVLAGARETHPFVLADGAHTASSTARPTHEHARPSTEPLPPLPGDVETVEISDASELAGARRLARAAAEELGFDGARVDDVGLVVTELVSNSLRHAGAPATISIWSDDDELVCEIRDDGWVVDPLVGRRRPRDDDLGGRGLWISQQVCDLLQQRQLPVGNVVRAHFSR